VGLFTRKLSLTPELEGLRGEVALSLTADERESLAAALPPMTGSEHVNGEFLAALWSSLHTMLAGQLGAFAGTVAEFIQGYNPELHLVGRVYFHLVENKNGDDPFAFLATYSTALNAEGESKHLPLRYALEEYADDHAKLLELLVTVHAAARESALIADLLESGELFSPLSWSAREAYRFLQEIPLYEEAGILCRIPNWWKGQAPRIGLAIRIGDQTPAMVGMNALLDFQPRLMLGDAELSEEEARRLLTETEGLAFIKNKWVAARPWPPIARPKSWARMRGSPSSRPCASP
jgi:non-specific serine/threonine protein kinase